MAGGIFISYRRDDAKHAAGRLVDRLGQTFSRDQLFLDIDNIEPGLDFVKVLSQQVQACDVLLAVIGPGWLDNRDKNGARRLDNPKDFVRIEIEAALARDIRVIPVLVDGAQMPGEGDLPASLHPLLVRNAVRLVHERFASDAEDLTRALAKVVLPASKGGWFGGGFTSAGKLAQRPNLEPRVRMVGKGEQQATLELQFNEPSRSNWPSIGRAILFPVGSGLCFLLMLAWFDHIRMPNEQGSVVIAAYGLAVIGLGWAVARQRGANASRGERVIYATTMALAAALLIGFASFALGIIR